MMIVTLWVVFLYLKAVGGQVYSYKSRANFSSLERCRPSSDFSRIPWTLQTSTFHNLGYPLVHSLCKDGGLVQGVDILGCKDIQDITWSHESEHSTRFGNGTSTIIVDPPLVDDEGESSGVFVINAIYYILYDLGYHPLVRTWSHNIKGHFSNEANELAAKTSEAWEKYIQVGSENPLQNVRNYISFQTEVGVEFYGSTAKLKPVNDSPFGRVFRWIIGYHKKNRFEQYEFKSEETHCLGGNHHLGEGLFCSSAGVIACPMFPFHHEKSRAVTADNRKSLKHNTVLVDSDALPVIAADRLEEALRAKGLKDVSVLLHRKRKRHDIPALYTQVDRFTVLLVFGFYPYIHLQFLNLFMLILIRVHEILSLLVFVYLLSLYIVYR
jgi:hypothetical protein